MILYLHSKRQQICSQKIHFSSLSDEVSTIRMFSKWEFLSKILVKYTSELNLFRNNRYIKVGNTRHVVSIEFSLQLTLLTFALNV